MFKDIVFLLVRSYRRIIQTKYPVVRLYAVIIHLEVLLGTMFIEGFLCQKDWADGTIRRKGLIPVHLNLVFRIQVEINFLDLPYTIFLY